MLVHSELGTATKTEAVTDLSEPSVIEASTPTSPRVAGPEHAAIPAAVVHEAAGPDPLTLLGAAITVASIAVRAQAPEHVQGVLGDLARHDPGIITASAAIAASSAHAETAKTQGIPQRFVQNA